MMLELNKPEREDRKTLFVAVILPLAISKAYTYRVPVQLNNAVEIGKRVVVQFGKSKIYTAIISQITEIAPAYEAKYLLDVLDEQPVVTENQLKLWSWISQYYLCYEGEVMHAALPAVLKLASETKIFLRDSALSMKEGLNDKEYLIVEALEIQPELRVSDISKLLGQKTVFPILKGLLNKGVIHISEEIQERYKPRTKAFIYLNPEYEDPENLRSLFTVLEKSPKQLNVLLAYLKLTKQKKFISKSEIVEESNSSASVIKSLLDKEVFIQQYRSVSRLETSDYYLEEFTLSDAQQQAFDEIEAAFKKKNVTLLYGVTASGKTQVYVKLIEKLLETDQQVLYLLPEIALTSQIIERLRKYFGDKVGVYHSKFNDNERAEVWQKVLKGEYQIVLGARSSVFLPFRKLGFIIVDEEHETSYKQFDPAPRYHARDTAIFLASLFNAKVLLGSATPSLESYYNAKIKKYGFVELAERFGGVQLPEIEIISIAQETKNKTIRSHFTSVLLKEIEGALARKEQVILFQNRRGYTPVLLCATCGFTPKCIHCDVSLTFHKSTGKLHCHYCGYKQDVIQECPACGSGRIEQKGFGTERIEDELKIIFPDMRIARMDLDSTRSKYSFQHLLNEFDDGLIDVLVGTQMVAKGLDFGNVTTIGIISADSLLNYPDFRAFERSFQLLAQVSGRAGRRDKRGKVIIQAYDTNHRVLSQTVRNDYNELFLTEILERKNFHYPPLYRLIRLEVKHKDNVKLNGIAERLAESLRQQFGTRVLGPEMPLVGRVRSYYIQSILIKAEKEGVSVVKIKSALKEVLKRFDAIPANKGTIVQIDVDPF